MKKMQIWMHSFVPSHFDADAEARTDVQRFRDL